MLDLFKEAATGVGAVVRMCQSADEAGGYLRSLAAGKRVVTSGLPERLASTVADIRTLPPAEAATADLCVSFAEAGIAATGSLLLDVHDTGGRAATALVSVHAVYVAASSIVADLAALKGRLAQLLERSGGAYLSLTSGPSRTADIERVLTIGVHGPRELHILVLEGE